MRLYPVEHRPHGHVAFYYLTRPRRGDVIDPRLAVLVDGTTPDASSPFHCSTCGASLAPPDIEEVGEGGGALHVEEAHPRDGR